MQDNAVKISVSSSYRRMAKRSGPVFSAYPVAWLNPNICVKFNCAANTTGIQASVPDQSVLPQWYASSARYVEAHSRVSITKFALIFSRPPVS